MRGLAAYVLAEALKVPNGVPTGNQTARPLASEAGGFPRFVAQIRAEATALQVARNWPHELAPFVV